MPEGPEIRRAADRIAQAIQGHRLRKIECHLAQGRKIEQALTDRRVTRIDTHGKAMLTRFDNDLTLYTHNQLYGRWYIESADQRPQTKRQLRLALITQKQAALLYSASTIELLNPQQIRRHPFLSSLGPDILHPTTDSRLITLRLEERRFSRRNLGGLLTDQRFLAGTGNYLRCEILHVSGLHPRQRVCDCTPQTISRLADACINLPRDSYATGGITNDRRRAQQLISEGADFEAARFHVYRREGLPCYRCGSTIIKLNLGGQPTYLCPNCQPETR